MERGDYCIGVSKDQGNKPFLFKVNSKAGSIVTGILEKHSHIPSQRITLEVSSKDVVLNLGQEPHPGKVHGFDVGNLYKGKKTSDDVGPVHFFYKPEKDVGDNLFRAFSKVSKVLRQNGLDFIIDPSTCIWEVLPYHKEKFAGMYIRSKKADTHPHRFQIRPEIMPATEYAYVILHELGHHLHMEYATGKKLQASWVRLYNTSILAQSIKKEKSLELLEGLLGQEDLPSDYKSNLSEEDTVVYKFILKTISQQHSLSVRELDLLFEADYKDDIRAVWPTRGVSKKDLAPIVTEYATKNFKELIAESIAYRLTGKKLPKAVEALVDKTFSFAKANRERH